MKYNIIIAVLLIAVGIRTIVDKQTGIWGNTFDLSKGHLYLYDGGFYILLGLIFLYYIWKNKKN